MLLSVCSCDVTYAFQSESTLYSCLNVKELLARSRREIWSLSDYNWTRTQNQLVRKRTLNHLASLAKWLSDCLRTKWFWFRVQLQSLTCFCFLSFFTNTFYDCNWTRTQNHLVLKRTLNHLAKLVECSFKN